MVQHPQQLILVLPRVMRPHYSLFKHVPARAVPARAVLFRDMLQLLLANLTFGHLLTQWR